MRRLLTGPVGADLGGALTALLLAGGGYAIASGGTGTSTRACTSTAAGCTSGAAPGTTAS
jgi:hypothetical protein